MTRDEFAAAAAVLDGGWPGDFAEPEEAAYHFLLDDFDAEQVLAALRALRGCKFRPAASEIVEAITGRSASIPTFDEMFDEMQRCLGARVPARGSDGRTILYADEGERWAARQAAIRGLLAEQHPLVRVFVERQGIRRLSETPFLDPDEGKWRLKELREAWVEHRETWDGREVAAIASGGTNGALVGMDPLAVLGLAQEQIGAGH